MSKQKMTGTPPATDTPEHVTFDQQMDTAPEVAAAASTPTPLSAAQTDEYWKDADPTIGSTTGEAAIPQIVLDPNAPVSQSQFALLMQQIMLTNERIATAMGTIAARQPMRRIPINEFVQKTPFNPTGRRDRKLSRVYFDNGAAVFVHLLTDAEIEKLELLTPGLYEGGTIRVLRRPMGSEDWIDVQYKNKDLKDRFANESKFAKGGGATTFESILNICIAEAARHAAEQRRLAYR